MHPNPRRVLPVVILLLALAAAAYWYFELRPAQQSNGALTASGTIEASQVQISPEVERQDHGGDGERRRPRPGRAGAGAP